MAIDNFEPTYAPISTRRLPDQVIDRLVDQMVNGTARVGQRLPSETELAREFGVGRSTLREAVKALAHIGLLEVRPGDGTYVRALPQDVEPLSRLLLRSHVIDVYEVRRTLEVDISSLACERRDIKDLERMREALKRCAQHVGPGEEDEFLEADLGFHLAVAAATKNEVFVKLYEAFRMVLRVVLAEVIRMPNVQRNANALHAALVDAIEARNADEAQEVTKRHLALVARLISDCERTRLPRDEEAQKDGV